LHSLVESLDEDTKLDDIEEIINLLHTKGKLDELLEQQDGSKKTPLDCARETDEPATQKLVAMLLILERQIPTPAVGKHSAKELKRQAVPGQQTNTR